MPVMKCEKVSEFRHDVGGSIVSRIDDNGFLRVDGVAAKTGVLTYMLADGSVRRELVPAETLFNVDSLATLQGVPVTLEHPNAVLDPGSAPQHSRGSVPVARADGDNLRVDVVITSQDAISAIASGKRQLSPGYRVELDPTPGEWNGMKYDAIQTKRIYNHLAIVGMARGGSDCRLNLDGFNCAVEVQPTTDEVKKMPTVKLSNGATVEVADASTAATIQNDINALGARADAASSMIEKAKFDELQGKHDALAEELEKSKSVKMDSAQIGSYIETVDQARKIKPDLTFKTDAGYLTETEVMASAIGIDAKAQSADYIRGRFDAALSLLSADAIRQQREDGAPAEPVLTGRKKFIAEQQKRGN